VYLIKYSPLEWYFWSIYPGCVAFSESSGFAAE